MADNINDLLENKSLKMEFGLRNLDLSEVFCATPNDLALENRRLKTLLEWVQKYSECRTRKVMEAEGYKFPPIDPGISPEEDWYIFERWIYNIPTRSTLKEQLPRTYTLKKPELLTDEGMQVEIRKLIDAIEKSGYSIGLNEGIPVRLVYSYLLETLGEEFNLMIEGGWILDGCSGYCPECFQRPWCASGGKFCWTEDKEAGKMYLCDTLNEYVSASSVSLQILKNNQADEEIDFNNSKQDEDDISSDPDLFDTTDDIDI